MTASRRPTADDPSAAGPPRLLGVLVTYRRPDDLQRTLRMLAGQTRRLDELVVVDNAPEPETEHLVDAASGAAHTVTYHRMPDNAGFPGGLAAGIESFIDSAADDDWIVVLDDDDPPEDPAALERLLRFGREMCARDPHTAAVGLRGARFDRRRGLLSRIPTRQIGDSVPVDCIAGNALPLYRTGALRRCGSFSSALFFSHEELELGLRLQRAGLALYADGETWRRRREQTGRPGDVSTRLFQMVAPNWRSYYSLRNTIHILREEGRGGAAAWISLSRGVLKPLMNLPRSPRASLKALSLNARAIADAWRRRLGRRVEPDTAPRPKKLVATARQRRTNDAYRGGTDA